MQCSITDCGEVTHAREWCYKHYLRWWKHGDPLLVLSKVRPITHGQTRRGKHHPLYKVWAEMRRRCNDARRPKYKDYGGRGIRVCERWEGVEGFANFLADMGERPKGLTLDRIDNDGHYEPGNCRWATATEQRRNRRDS